MSQPPSSPRLPSDQAGLIAIATGLTRIAGLLREQINAAVFGAGIVYGAFQYAGLIPSLFLVILGGLNGPLHSAMVTALANRSPEQQRTIVNTLTLTIGGLLAGVSLGLYLLAPQCIDLLAPGLGDPSAMRSLAIRQLRILAPVVWFGGMSGISIGMLASQKRYFIPTLSPLLLSLTVSAGVLLWARFGDQSLLAAGQSLAIAFVCGAGLQWLWLWWAQRPIYWPSAHIAWPWRHPDIQRALWVIGAALLFASMTYANWYIDLAFASLLPSPDIAASALTFANLLAQAPIGLMANVLLMPLLPQMAQSVAVDGKSELKRSLMTGLKFILRWGLPISMLMAALATPIVGIVYQRGAFGAAETALVAKVLAVYAIGLCFLLARDLLIRALYVLNAHSLLLLVSCVGLGANLLFNLLLYQPLGITGLVLGTNIVNLLVVVWLLLWLNKRLGITIRYCHILFLSKLLLGHVSMGALLWGIQAYWLQRNSLLSSLPILFILAVLGYSASALIWRHLDRAV